MTIGQGKCGWEAGVRSQEILLAEETLTLFMKYVKEERGEEFLSYQLRCHQSEIMNVEKIDSTERDTEDYGQDCMRLQVNTIDPGGCMFKFFQEHKHDDKPRAVQCTWIKDGLKLFCTECGIEDLILKEYFDPNWPEGAEDETQKEDEKGEEDADSTEALQSDG